MAYSYDVFQDPSSPLYNPNDVPAGGGAAPPGASTVPDQTYTNVAAMQAADGQAQIAYNEERLRLYDLPVLELEKDKLAFQKAQQVWTQTYQQASLSGYYGGDWAAMPNGQYKWVGQGTAPGGQSLVNQLPAGGTIAQSTLDQQKEDNSTSLNYLDLLSRLRGPANIFQYLKVLNGTPQGLRDVVSRAAGNFGQIGLGQQQAAQPAPAQPAVAPSQSVSTSAPNTTPAPNVDPSHVAAAAAGAIAGLVGNYPSAPAAQPQQSSTGTVNPDGSVSVNTLLGDAANPSGVASQQDLAAANGPLPNPLQWNARNVTTMDPSQKDVLNATYENQGMDPKDVDAIFKSGMPNYGGPSHGVVTGLGF